MDALRIEAVILFRGPDLGIAQKIEAESLTPAHDAAWQRMEQLGERPKTTL